METIIKVAAEFTPAWINQALVNDGHGRVTAVVAQAIGTGQLGAVVRLALTRNDGGTLPDTLVCKLAAEGEKARRTGVAVGAYEAEVRFYQQIAPTVAMRTPRCWLAEYDPVAGWFTLVLEDLKDYRPGDNVVGGSIEQARLALDQLVRLQAPRWDDPRLRDLPWLADRARLENLFARFSDSLPGFLEHLAPLMDADVVALARRVLPRSVNYVRGWTGPQVVQHGDYRLDNMLFGTDTGHAPLVVVDWQTVRLGPPLVDAAFYLGAGLTTDLRVAHEEELLREYHDKLLSAGVRDFSWQQCWKDYRRHSLYGFLLGAGASMMVEQTERGLSMFRNSLECHGRHVLQLDAEEFLP